MFVIISDILWCLIGETCYDFNRGGDSTQLSRFKLSSKQNSRRCALNRIKIKLVYVILIAEENIVQCCLALGSGCIDTVLIRIQFM